MNRNERYDEMVTCFFQNKKEQGRYAANELLRELDMDDEEDMDIIYQILVRGVFKSECTQLLDDLKNYGLDFNVRWQEGRNTALQYVYNSNTNTEIFQKIVALGADPYQSDYKGNTLLSLLTDTKLQTRSMNNERAEFATYIINHFDIDSLFATNSFGATPLHMAILNNHYSIAEELIRKGVNLNVLGTTASNQISYAINFEGMSPLSLSCFLGDYTFFELLMQAGAEDSIADNEGNTSAFYVLLEPPKLFRESYYSSYSSKLAIIENKQSMLKSLPHINTFNQTGKTPFLQALSQSGEFYEKMAETLMERDVDLTTTDNEGKTALHYCAQNNHSIVLKDIIKNINHLNERCNNGKTPLFYAVENHNEKIAKYLVKKGADYTIKDNQGVSVLELAANHGMNEFIELMI